jgi:transposase
MSLYGGIDLHANNSVIVLLNEQDEVIYQKRLPNDLPMILGQLAPYHAELQGLVVESRKRNKNSDPVNVMGFRLR